jgi:hypothetical protein
VTTFLFGFGTVDFRGGRAISTPLLTARGEWSVIVLRPLLTIILFGDPFHLAHGPARSYWFTFTR